MQKTDPKKLPSTATIHYVINRIYLKEIKNPNRKSLARRFSKFMSKGTKWTQVTKNDIDRFLGQFSGNTLKTNRSYMRDLERFLGLDDTPPSGCGRKSKKKELEPMKREWKKKEQKLLEIIARHNETIDRLQTSNRELREKLDRLISKGVPTQNLEEVRQQEAEVKKRITDLKKEEEAIKEKFRRANFYTVDPCPETYPPYHVPLVDCLNCPKQMECGVIAKQWPSEH